MNGYQPNYTTLLYGFNNHLVSDIQNNTYNCGPASLTMASMMLYKYTLETTFAKYCLTNKNVTTPENLVAGAKKLGFKLTKINRNIDNVKKAQNQGSNKNGVFNTVINHFQTKNATCLGFINDYGHYELIYNTNGNNYSFADPTKGLKT